MGYEGDVGQPEVGKPTAEDHTACENHTDELINPDDNQLGEDNKWWDSESQYLVDSQQLVEGLSLCEDLLQSQSPHREGNADNIEKKRSVLSDYAHLGPDHLKKDLEECQNLDLDPANIDLDTPPDFRLSQLVSLCFLVLI